MVRLLLPITILCTLLSGPALAGQHLVRSGEGWAYLAADLNPGDEIILMPGRHRPIRLADVHGTAKRPIVIRGADPEDPPVIESEREGIRLEGVSHLVLKDLKITGASINGITIRGLDDERHDTHVRVQNVTVTGTGPTGRRHAIQLESIRHAAIENCTIEGWGGAGIDVTESSDVRIKSCRLTGLESYGQKHGIAVRGGSERVWISGCSLQNAGVEAITLGGAADPPLSITGEPLPHRPTSTQTHEAVRVEVRQCVIEGSSNAFSFKSAQRCSVLNNTVIDPKALVVSVDLAPATTAITPSKQVSFGNNIVVWEPGAITRAIRVGPNYQPGSFKLEENLWWAAETPQRLTELLAFPETPVFPQVSDLDPKLGDDHRPTVAAAEVFGAHAP